MIGPDILDQAEALLAQLQQGGRTVATAESCTGGGAVYPATSLVQPAGSGEVTGASHRCNRERCYV